MPIVLALIVVLATAKTFAANDVAWEQCMILYDQRSYEQSEIECMAASKALDPDMPRMRRIVAQKPPRAQADIDFALDIGSRVVGVSYTQALLTSRSGQAQLAHRFARDAADWLLDIAAILQVVDPGHDMPKYRVPEQQVAGFSQRLEQFEPGLILSELARARRPTQPANP